MDDRIEVVEDSLAAQSPILAHDADDRPADLGDEDVLVEVDPVVVLPVVAEGLGRRQPVDAIVTVGRGDELGDVRIVIGPGEVPNHQPFDPRSRAVQPDGSRAGVDAHRSAPYFCCMWRSTPFIMDDHFRRSAFRATASLASSDRRASRSSLR